MIQDTTLITPSPTSEQARDRSLNLEHTVEENGDCSCCNDVRHVHDYLEYTLTLYLNLDVCEPGSKNKCEKDLRYEVTNHRTTVIASACQNSLPVFANT